MARGRNKGTSLAQSGGKDTTFGTARGGTPMTRGSTDGKVRGHGRMNSGSEYAIRSEAGNNATVKQTGHVGQPPPVHPGGPGNFGIKRIKILKPVLRGSTNALKGKYK